VFDLNKNIGLTEGLIPNSVDFSALSQVFKTKKQNIKVNAFKLDQKTIVIKGFNEEIDNSLLKTIDLDIKNIDFSSNETSFGVDIVPVTIDIALDDEIVQLSDNNGADIVEYEVISGDSISSIADRFNVSVDTILWANDLNSKSGIQIGQKLVILPVSGISYKVKSGDTVSGLSTRFNVTERDIIGFNKTDGEKLIIGEIIIIPGGKISTQFVEKTNTKTNSGKATNISSRGTNTTGMIRPINGVKTQGIHGNNGVDFGANIGTPVYAAMSGVVTLTRGGDAWNGGYGNYIVIKHNNGTQTLYAHLSVIGVNKGQNVEKGQTIGKSGNSGRSTGPHLHFEVRGAKNPF
jgi:murein DD-endopeptidase MepM/ murein hydrolase activator NlpD